jgi:transketolase C-terminal domain/subunit
VPEVIGIYAWSELLPEKLVVTINGVHEKNVEISYVTLEDITIIRILPTKSGTVLISSG